MPSTRFRARRRTRIEREQMNFQEEKQMKKRALATVLLLSMILGVLTACEVEITVPETGAAAATTAETASDEKGEGVMTYAEYAAAETGDAVTVETYIQGANAWWDGKITLYTQDKDGAYFIYEMPCAEEDAAKLVPGTKIKVTGTKSQWNGEVEIVDAAFEIEDGTYIAQPKDVTDLLGEEALIDSMNQLVSFKGLTVEASVDQDGTQVPFLYKWDGSGKDGDDVYFNVSKDGKTFAFLVRSYLTGPDTDVYKAAKELKVGDTIDCEGFLYWYDGVNPHITAITVH